MADQNPWMPPCEHGIPLTACRDCSTDNLLACRALLAMVWGGEARVPVTDRIWREQVAKALGREDKWMADATAREDYERVYVHFKGLVQSLRHQLNAAQHLVDWEPGLRPPHPKTDE